MTVHTKRNGWIPTKEIFELVHTGEEIAKSNNDVELQQLVDSVLSTVVIGCRNRYIRPTDAQAKVIALLESSIYNHSTDRS